MKVTALSILTVLAAGPAAAQVARLPDAPPSAEQILQQAPPAAAALFTIDPKRGLVHRPSGYACPLVEGSAALTAIDLTSGVAGCRYADSFQPVMRIEFLGREAGDVLAKPYCEALPKTLGVDAGSPFKRRLDGPLVPAQLGQVKVGGQWVPIRTCAWMVEPFRLNDVTIQASTLQPDGGWAARLVQTLARPARGRTPIYSMFDELRPFYSLAEVVAGPEAEIR